MKLKAILKYGIALVWIMNGLLCKLLGFVPRHEEIVARVLSDSHSSALTMLIGIGEVFIAIWVITGRYSRVATWLQIILVASMNIIEFMLVPDLLLWGRFNIIFAFIFVLLIWMHEYQFKDATSCST